MALYRYWRPFYYYLCDRYQLGRTPYDAYSQLTGTAFRECLLTPTWPRYLLYSFSDTTMPQKRRNIRLSTTEFLK